MVARGASFFTLFVPACGLVAQRLSYVPAGARSRRLPVSNAWSRWLAWSCAWSRPPACGVLRRSSSASAQAVARDGSQCQRRLRLRRRCSRVHSAAMLRCSERESNAPPGSAAALATHPPCARSCRSAAPRPRRSWPAPLPLRQSFWVVLDWSSPRCPPHRLTRVCHERRRPAPRSTETGASDDAGLTSSVSTRLMRGWYEQSNSWRSVRCVSLS